MTREDLQSVISLVSMVGGKVLGWRTDDRLRKIHSKKDYKTEADRQAHELLLKGLNQLFPGIQVVSEEDVSHSENRPDRYWVIDPIDGTASWYEGFLGFVTQVAFVEYNRPILGVIHAPALNKTWSGIVGKGAFLNGVRLPILKEKNNQLVLVDNYPVPKRGALVISKAMPITKYVESGSIGLKAALVADGTADIFVKDVVVRDWDIAPIVPIISEVGGSLCLSDGQPYNFTGSYEKTQGIVVARDIGLARNVVDALVQCGES